MSGAPVDALRESYGQDWASLDGRERSLEIIERVASEDFQFQLSAEVGGRVLNGLGKMMEFIEALEQDFSELRYVADEIIQQGDCGIVLGYIEGRARYSKLPLKSEFGHVWRFRDGRATRMEAFLSRSKALDSARGEAASPS
jgi:ketosteroid isomerase-like protein